MKKKNFRKLFAVLIAACMMVLCVPVTSQATVRVSAPRLKTARSTSSGMYLNWTRISNASGYVIYRNNKCIGGVKGSRSLAYLDKKAKTGSRYTYSVRAFRQYGKKRVYSNASNRIQGVRKAVSNNGLGTPVQSGVRFWKNLSATGGNGVTYGTTWNKIKCAAGYQVQIRGYEYGNVLTYSKFTKKNSYGESFSSYDKIGMRIRAYKIVGGKNVYGPFSKWSFSNVR